MDNTAKALVLQIATGILLLVATIFWGNAVSELKGEREANAAWERIHEGDQELIDKQHEVVLQLLDMIPTGFSMAIFSHFALTKSMKNSIAFSLSLCL